MGEHERDVGERPSKLRPIFHLQREYLKLKQPAIIGEAGQIPSEGGGIHAVRGRSKTILWVIVPVQLLTNSAHQRVFRLCGQHVTRSVGLQVGKADNGMRPAGSISY